MIFASPFAIFVYVILAFSLATTIIVHLKKEGLITDILRSSPDRRARVTKSYRQLIKIHKLMVCIMPIAIAVMVSLYFSILKIDILLLMSIFLAILIIHSIEDIRFRRSVIVRLETAEYATAQQTTSTNDSQEVIAARVQKMKRIPFLFIIVFIIVFVVGPLIALYFTLDMPWWLFAAIMFFALLAALVGFTLGYKRQKKNLHS